MKKTKKLQKKLLPPRPRKPRTHARKKLAGAVYINGSGVRMDAFCGCFEY